LIPLGSWSDSRRLADILEDARSGRSWSPADDAARKRLLVSHNTASAHELTVALQRGRDALADWLAGDPQWPVAEWGLRSVCSPVGPLPVLTLLHGVSYEMAKTALDLQPAGCQPPPGLLKIGLTALMDLLGAFTARAGVAGSLIAIGTDFNVGTGALDGDWVTKVLTDDQVHGHGPTVSASTDVLLDVTAGRAAVPPLYTKGELRVTDLAGLARLLPVLEHVPGVPAAASLGRTGRMLVSASDLLSKLPRWGRN